MAAATKQCGGRPPQGPIATSNGSGSDGPLDDFATRLIRRKARELSRKPGFSRSDQPDLEQELSLILLRRLADFDATRAHRNAFATTVVERYAATILEHRSAEMRTHRRTGGSLNVPAIDADGRTVELSNIIPSSQQSRRTGQYPRPHEEAFDLAQDTNEMVRRLPPRLRDLCERLKHDSISTVARDLGLSRTEIYRRISRIRQRLEEAGLRGYS
jgi:RNA polymerase sigma factor (sigma-70 family)